MFTIFFNLSSARIIAATYVRRLIARLIAPLFDHVVPGALCGL
jgi:hypothetical protein